MAVSRRVAFLCLGTILVCFFFVKATEADFDDYGEDIHTVRHSAAGDCSGGHPDKGDQCREEDDALEDDDFDDTYKIVNNIAVSLSSSGKANPPAEESEDQTLEAEEELANNVIVLGH